MLLFFSLFFFSLVLIIFQFYAGGNNSLSLSLIFVGDCGGWLAQDEETGVWYQHKGRDFKVPLVDCLLDSGGGNVIGAKGGFSMWPGYKINH
jgi:hypothetical protein